jgi:N-acyl-D-amino-acid deacylase
VRYDVLIKNARIIDGMGNPWFRGEIAVRDGRIAAVGRAATGEAVETVDAGGLVVCPGFIDTHTHSDFVFFIDPTAQSKVRQGVTTEVTGNCGMSAAPLEGAARHMAQILASGFQPRWTGVREYLELVTRQPKTVNLAPLIGHANLRQAVIGMDDRHADARELARMSGLLREGIESGAVGLSMGLYFSPGNYAGREELVGVMSVAGEHGAPTACHIRDEGVKSVGFIPALQEFIGLGREAGAPIHISHLKAFGPDVWGVSPQVLEMIDAARAEGLDVTCDQYPYAASGGLIAQDTLPTEAVRGMGPEEVSRSARDPAFRAGVIEQVRSNLRKRGGADRLTIANFGADRSLEGKTLQRIAEEHGREPAEVVLDLIADLYEADWVSQSMSQDDVDRIIRYPWTMIGSDGNSLSVEGPLSEGNPHPRNFGTFPRVLGHYVRDRGVLRLEDAVRKMTSLPAQRFCIRDRGVLEEGKWADLVLFDLDAVTDAPFESPKQYPAGIPHVMVNGQWVIRNGSYTGSLPGRLVRRR